MTSTFAATLPTFHTAVQALQATSDREGRIRHRQSIACQPQLIQHITQTALFSTKETAAAIHSSAYSCTACDISSNSNSGIENTFSAREMLYFRHNGEKKKALQEDDIHLHCCFVSKVRRQLGILQLRRGNGTSCYWQGTDV